MTGPKWLAMECFYKMKGHSCNSTKWNGTCFEAPDVPSIHLANVFKDLHGATSQSAKTCQNYPDISRSSFERPSATKGLQIVVSANPTPYRKHVSARQCHSVLTTMQGTNHCKHKTIDKSFISVLMQHVTYSGSWISRTEIAPLQNPGLYKMACVT